MLTFDAAIVGVADGADDIACFADAEQIGESEISPRFEIFVIEASSKLAIIDPPDRT